VHKSSNLKAADRHWYLEQEPELCGGTQWNVDWSKGYFHRSRQVPNVDMSEHGLCRNKVNVWKRFMGIHLRDNEYINKSERVLDPICPASEKTPPQALFMRRETTWRRTESFPWAAWHCLYLLMISSTRVSCVEEFRFGCCEHTHMSATQVSITRSRAQV